MRAVARAWFWRGAETLGSMAAKPVARLIDEMDFLAVVLSSVGLIVRGQWRFLFGHTVQQIYFTAVQRAYLVTVVGSIIGALMAFPLIVFRIHDPALLGRIMHIMMYHQLNPILAALFVSGLSGSAITAELGEIKANQAIDHLAAMGVDPHGFFVLPRLLGMILSLPILTC